jgi:hypothetical protein
MVTLNITVEVRGGGEVVHFTMTREQKERNLGV